MRAKKFRRKQNSQNASKKVTMRAKKSKHNQKKSERNQKKSKRDQKIMKRKKVDTQAKLSKSEQKS